MLQLVVVAFTAKAQNTAPYGYMPAAGATQMVWKAKTYVPSYLNEPVEFGFVNSEDIKLYPASLFQTDEAHVTVNHTRMGNLSVNNFGIIFSNDDDSDPNAVSHGKLYLLLQFATPGNTDLFSETPWINGNTGNPGSGRITNVIPADQFAALGWVGRFGKVSLGLALKGISSSQANGSWNGSSSTSAFAMATDLSVSYSNLSETNDAMVYRARISNLGPFGRYSVFHYSSPDPGDPSGSTRYLPTYFGLGIKKKFTLQSGNQIGFMLDGGKELFPKVPNPDNAAAVKSYQSIGPFMSPSLFKMNGAFGFALGGQYIVQTASDANVNFSGGYTNGSYFKGVSLSVGKSLKNKRIFAGYQFPMGTPGGYGFKQVSFGISFGGN